MMSAQASFVKTGQMGIVDQAQREPAGEHAGAAIGHEGQRKTGHRHHAQVHPHVLKDLDDEPAGNADRDKSTEGISSPDRDHQCSQYQETQNQQQAHAAQEPELLPSHREHEVGPLVRDEAALGLTPLEEPLTLPPTRTDRNADLTSLVTNALRVR